MCGADFSMVVARCVSRRGYSRGCGCDLYYMEFDCGSRYEVIFVTLDIGFFDVLLRAYLTENSSTLWHGSIAERLSSNSRNIIAEA